MSISLPIHIIALAVVILVVSHGGSTAAAKWDYTSHPVTVTEDRESPPPWYYFAVAYAFDGAGAQGSKPGSSRAWLQAAPTGDAPVSCEIDYGVPVAVSAFAHYFYVPDGPDLRRTWPAPAAWRRVRISARDEGGEWAVITNLSDLPADCPQVLPVSSARPHRYWRIQILELHPGATNVITYEIETYTGGTPTPSRAVFFPDLPAAFARRVMTRKLSSGAVKVAFMNYGNAGAVACSLDSRDLDGARVWPKTVRRMSQVKPAAKWDGKAVRIGPAEIVVLEWGFRR